MAQRPYALPRTLTVAAAAGDPDSLRWLIIVTIVAVLVVGPALALLYRLDFQDRLAADHDVDLTEATRARLRCRTEQQQRVSRPRAPAGRAR